MAVEKSVSTFSIFSIALTAAFLLFAGCLNLEKPYEPAGSPTPSLSPSSIASSQPIVSATPGDEIPPSPPGESGGEQPPAAPS